MKKKVSPNHLTYTGTSGDDVIVGLGDNDTIFGLEGNDILIGGEGHDQLYGGPGDDVFRAENLPDLIYETVGNGFDRVYTSVSYTLPAGQEIEMLSYIAPSMVVVGLILTGNEFGQTIIGSAGDDDLRGGLGDDVMAGGPGSDRYRVQDAGDVVLEYAGEGGDWIFVDVNRVHIYALRAGSEIELLAPLNRFAPSGVTFIGNEYDDVINGAAGADVLIGGGGNDLLTGETGSDCYRVEDLGDLIREWADNSNPGDVDAVYVAMHLSGYTLPDDSVFGPLHIEVLAAIDATATNNFNLTGNALGNTIYGSAGANILNGAGGADFLVGYGGADTFAFTTALGGGNVDGIMDFAAGTDKIGFDDAVFTAIGGPGALNPNAFVVGSAAADADDRIVYNNATGQLFYDADGNGAGAAVLFATLSGAPTLAASDFTII